MWQWPLVLLAAAKFALAVETSSGPTSEAESELIWKEALTAYESKDFVQASNHLQRLVDRYPGAKGYLKAHLYLGVSRLEMKQAEQSLEPLRFYVQATGKSLDGVLGRLELGRAYLALEKKHEALLSAIELDRLTKTKALSAKRADALIFKSRALMELGRGKEARLVLDAVSKLTTQSSTELATRGQASAAELEWKIQECEKLPGKKPLDEGQLRDRISRRGQCLVESTNLFRNTLNTVHEPSSQLASEELGDAWIRYFDSCSNPLPPPGKKTASQLKAYRDELKTALVADCMGRVRHAHTLLSEWKAQVPAQSVSSTDYVIRTLDRLKEASQ